VSLMLLYDLSPRVVLETPQGGSDARSSRQSAPTGLVWYRPEWGAAGAGLDFSFTPALRVDEHPARPELFEEWTEKAGLHFVHDAGPLPQAGNYFMPQIIGSGAAVFDFDGDGLHDIYLLSNGGDQYSSTNRLFRQVPGGRILDVVWAQPLIADLRNKSPWRIPPEAPIAVLHLIPYSAPLCSIKPGGRFDVPFNCMGVVKHQAGVVA